MSELVEEARAVWRWMRRAPGVTVAAVLALSLGIAGATTVFSSARAVFVRPASARMLDRLVQIRQPIPLEPGQVTAFGFGWTPDQFEAVRERGDLFDAVAGLRSFDQLVTEPGPPARTTGGYLVKSSFFEALGTVPALGRGVARDESANVVVLSHAYWLRRFGGDPNVIGRLLVTGIEGAPQSYEVIGVMPASFRLPLLRGTDDGFMPDPEVMFFLPQDQLVVTVVARLAPGVTVARAQAELDRLAERRRAAPVSAEDRTLRFAVTSVALSPRVMAGRQLGLLALAASCLLVVACVTASILLLERARRDANDTAVRAVLGATAGRLFRERLTAASFVALLGGGGGVGLSLAALHLVRGVQARALPGLPTASIDGVTLGVVLATTFGFGLLAGLASGLRVSRLDPAPWLRGGSGLGEPATPLRGATLCFTVAVTVVSLASAAMVARAAARLARTDPGFDSAGLVSFRLTAVSEIYPTRRQLSSFWERIDAQVASAPGVRAFTKVTNPPFDLEENRQPITAPVGGTGESVHVRADARLVKPGYFSVMGIPLLAGRGFVESDGNLFTREGTRVVVVNDVVADLLWPGLDPIGRELYNVGPGRALPDPQFALTVVGVVGEVKTLGFEVRRRPQVYWPASRDFSQYTFLVRAREDPRPVLDSLVTSLTTSVPGLYIEEATTMDDRIERSLSETRFYGGVLGAFGVCSLALSLLGLCATAAGLVSVRLREIGVRIALGARPRDVIGWVVAYHARPVALGTVAGLAGTAAATGVLRALVYGLGAFDPGAFFIVALAVAAVTVFASLVAVRPAFRHAPAHVMRG